MQNIGFLGKKMATFVTEIGKMVNDKKILIILLCTFKTILLNFTNFKNVFFSFYSRMETSWTSLLPIF